MTYILGFLIGSSAIVALLFYISVYNYVKDDAFLLDYRYYLILVPLYFGLMTMFAIWLQKNLGLSLSTSLLYTSILSSFMIMLAITYLPVYKIAQSASSLRSTNHQKTLLMIANEMSFGEAEFYKWSTKRLWQQYNYLLLSHFLTYNFIIYYLINLYIRSIYV